MPLASGAGLHIVKQYKIVAREASPGQCGRYSWYSAGGNSVPFIAGHVRLKPRNKWIWHAAGVAAAGCRLMRATFKPRTSPYAFQGLGSKGWSISAMPPTNWLPIVTELMDVRMLETFLEWDVDVIQIGTRNMQNFDC